MREGKETHLLALRVPHGLVDTEDQASGLDGGAESVGLDETWLPDELQKRTQNKGKK